jgi:hypothetical protein
MNTWPGPAAAVAPGQGQAAQELPPEPPTSADAAPAAAAPSPIPPDIARLFRRTLAQGRMHPLMPLLLHYRQTQREVPPP